MSSTFVLIVEFLNLTFAPLVNEIVRFAQDLPGLATQLQDQIERLSEIYARLQLPGAVREWIDSLIAGIGQGGSGAPAGRHLDLLPGPDRRG